MNYTAEGKIIHSSEQSGVSAAGRSWRKMTYVLETFEQHPAKIPFTVFGDKIDSTAISVGDKIRLVFSVQGREYQGRWYTDINCESAQKIDKQNKPIVVSEYSDTLPF